MMYASHRRTCSAPGFMRPTNGVDEDNPNFAVPGDGGATPNYTPTTGTTVAAWAPGGGGGLPTIDGLQIWKRMNNQLSAFQMNTGEKIWSLPVGPTPERITDHPLLAGVDVPESGGVGWSIQMIAGDLLIQTRSLSQGTAQYDPDAPLELHARQERVVLDALRRRADRQRPDLLARVHLEGRELVVHALPDLQAVDGG